MEEIWQAYRWARKGDIASLLENVITMYICDSVHESDDQIRLAQTYIQTVKGNCDYVKESLEYFKRNSYYHPEWSSYFDEPFCFACMDGNMEMVKLFLPDIPIKENFYCSPLSCACSTGNLYLVKLLFETIEKRREFTINPSDDSFGISEMCLRKAIDHVEIVKFLIEKGTSDRRDEETSPSLLTDLLCVACSKDRTDVVKLLLEHGARVDKNCIYLAGWHSEILPLLVPHLHGEEKKFIEQQLHDAYVQNKDDLVETLYNCGVRSEMFATEHCVISARYPHRSESTRFLLNKGVKFCPVERIKNRVCVEIAEELLFIPNQNTFFGCVCDEKFMDVSSFG